MKRTAELPTADAHAFDASTLKEPCRALDLSSSEPLVSQYLFEVSRKVGDFYPSPRQRAFHDPSGAVERMELIPPGVISDATLVIQCTYVFQIHNHFELFPFTRYAVTGMVLNHVVLIWISVHLWIFAWLFR